MPARRHGESKRSREYRCFISMRQRCLNPKSVGYANYGGRGVAICERWSAFETFLADMGRCPEGMSLDRIDPNGHYEPENCRWATVKEQVRNRRSTVRYTLDETEKPLGELCEVYRQSYRLVKDRLNRLGWPLREALTYPPGQNLFGHQQCVDWNTRTHCKNGHPLSDETTRLRPNGSKVCRVCNAISHAKRRARLKTGEPV